MRTEGILLFRRSVTFLDKIIILLTKTMKVVLMVCSSLNIAIYLLIFYFFINIRIVLVWSLFFLIYTMMWGRTVPIEAIRRIFQGQKMKNWRYQHDTGSQYIQKRVDLIRRLIIIGFTFWIDNSIIAEVYWNADIKEQGDLSDEGHSLKICRRLKE